MAKLNPEQSEQFLEDAKTMSNSELAEKYDISVSTVKKLKKGKETAKDTKELTLEKRVKSLDEKIDSLREEIDEGFDDLSASIEDLQKSKGKASDKEKDKKWNCSGCGTEFDDLIKYCPGCGKELEVKDAEQTEVEQTEVEIKG